MNIAKRRSCCAIARYPVIVLGVTFLVQELLASKTPLISDSPASGVFSWGRLSFLLHQKIAEPESPAPLFSSVI